MKNYKNYLLIICTSLIIFLTLFKPRSVEAQVLLQQPTVAIPTVTGTPEGVTATVNLDQEESINVRTGPGVFYDKIGVLLPGQKAPVLGRTAGGDWILITYPGGPNNQGWVYSPVVYISPGELPIIEPPATLTPQVTETINPTLAAQFLTTPVPTRLATFTPAEPLVIATYQDLARTSFLGNIPMGLVIILLGGLGGLLALISIFRSR